MIDMDRIKEVHGLAQARKESQHADPMAAHVGTKLFRDGHRKGFWDGIEYVLSHLDDFVGNQQTEKPRRTLTVDIDTGEWVEGGPISGQDGARVASSVLPGMPVEEVERAYSEWMCADTAPVSDVAGFEGTREALDGLGR